MFRTKKNQKRLALELADTALDRVTDFIQWIAEVEDMSTFRFSDETKELAGLLADSMVKDYGQFDK